MVLNMMYMGLYPRVAHSSSSGSEFPDKALILSAKHQAKISSISIAQKCTNPSLLEGKRRQGSGPHHKYSIRIQEKLNKKEIYLD